MWPNPATDNFNLKVESVLDTPINLYISDVTGSLIAFQYPESSFIDISLILQLFPSSVEYHNPIRDAG